MHQLDMLAGKRRASVTRFVSTTVRHVPKMLFGRPGVNRAGFRNTKNTGKLIHWIIHLILVSNKDSLH